MKQQRHILLIDDNRDQLFIFKKYFQHTQFNLITAANVNNALKTISENAVDLIILDYNMPEMNGAEFMKILSGNPRFGSHRKIPVIMLSSLQKEQIPEDELRDLGVLLFLSKPFKFPELIQIIENLIALHSRHYEYKRETDLRIQSLDKEKYHLQSQLRMNSDFSNIIAVSSKMRALVAKLEEYTLTRSHVFLIGIPGTEKERIAGALHFNSKRADMPFISFCGSALPAPRMDAELFGCNRPAKSAYQGLIQKAEGGTLFLPDFNSLDTTIQEKIIRFITTGCLEKMNSAETFSCETRIMVGIDPVAYQKISMQSLNKAREEKTVLEVHIPPLKDRKDDILPLVDSFFDKYKKQKELKLSIEAKKILQKYDWRGDVEELETVIRNLANALSEGTVTCEDLPREIRHHKNSNDDFLKNNLPFKEARKQWISQFEKQYLKSLFACCNGNISKMAKLAQVNRMTIYRMMHAHNIQTK